MFATQLIANCVWALVLVHGANKDGQQLPKSEAQDFFYGFMFLFIWLQVGNPPLLADEQKNYFVSVSLGLIISLDVIKMGETSWLTAVPRYRGYKSPQRTKIQNISALVLLSGGGSEDGSSVLNFPEDVFDLVQILSAQNAHSSATGK